MAVLAADVPEALKRPLDASETAEIERFIVVLDYEKHSGAEHRAVEYLKRIYGRLLTVEAERASA